MTRGASVASGEGGALGSGRAGWEQCEIRCAVWAVTGAGGMCAPQLGFLVARELSSSGDLKGAPEGALVSRRPVFLLYISENTSRR